MSWSNRNRDWKKTQIDFLSDVFVARRRRGNLNSLFIRPHKTETLLETINTIMNMFPTIIKTIWLWIDTRSYHSRESQGIYFNGFRLMSWCDPLERVGRDWLTGKPKRF